MDIYDSEANTWKTAKLSAARSTIGGIGVQHLAFFAGGNGASNVASSTVDIYNSVTDTWTTDTLPDGARNSIYAGAAGNNAVFGCGKLSSNYPTAVDIYSVVPVAQTSGTYCF